MAETPSTMLALGTQIPDFTLTNAVCCSAGVRALSSDVLSSDWSLRGRLHRSVVCRRGAENISAA